MDAMVFQLEYVKMQRDTLKALDTAMAGLHGLHGSREKIAGVFRWLRQLGN